MPIANQICECENLAVFNKTTIGGMDMIRQYYCRVAYNGQS
jgi:hypothetical protein